MANGSAAGSLQARWPEVLEAVKRERRVAWMILSHATVDSLVDGMLTLRFPREGDLRGFTTSGCDADLRRVLSSSFGVNAMVKGAVLARGDDPPHAPPASGGTPSPQTPQAVRRDPAPRDDLPPPPDDSFAPDDEPDDEPLPPGPPELTGVDLITRELGARIISEIETS